MTYYQVNPQRALTIRASLLPVFFLAILAGLFLSKSCLNKSTAPSDTHPPTCQDPPQPRATPTQQLAANRRQHLKWVGKAVPTDYPCWPSRQQPQLIDLLLKILGLARAQKGKSRWRQDGRGIKIRDSGFSGFRIQDAGCGTCCVFGYAWNFYNFMRAL